MEIAGEPPGARGEAPPRLSPGAHKEPRLLGLGLGLLAAGL